MTKSFFRPAASLLVFASVLFGGIHSGLSQIKIMPLGDSITKGAVDPAPSLAGYRAQLFNDLKAAGISYRFAGCSAVNSPKFMIDAGQQFHNGYGSYRIDQIVKNLDGVAGVGNGDNNQGGYWMTGGNGTGRSAVFPDIVLLLAGTNDLGSGADEKTLESRMTELLAWFQRNRPQALVFVSTVVPRGPTKPQYVEYNQAVVKFNAWIKASLPSFGTRFRLVDLYSLFVDPQGNPKAESSPDGIFLKDGIHPSHGGYVAMGNAWFNAIRPSLGSGR